MKRVTQRISGILLCAVELLVGILLLIDPSGLTSGMILAAGILLLLAGLWQMIRYFLMKPEDAAQRQLLFRGLCAMLAGGFAALHVEWILSVFPFLTMLYGLCVLLIGLRRIQWTVDMIRLNMRRWYWPAIGALLSLAVAAVILLNPFGTTVAMWTFTGIALIAEAVVDILTLVFEWWQTKEEKATAKPKARKEKTKVAQTDPEATVPETAEDAPAPQAPQA